MKRNETAMIVGKQKPFEEIWEMIKSFKKVLGPRL